METVEGAVLSPTARRAGSGWPTPGRVPEAVHARVDRARSGRRHHRDLPGGGAWFVQRKVPGRDGMVLQVRADPGTDDATSLRQVARRRPLVHTPVPRTDTVRAYGV